MSAGDADVLVLGAGAAGLSLAVRLRERAPSLRVMVVDARTSFDHDRTFCSFAQRPHPFEAAIDRRYGRVALADGRGVVERPTGRTPYTRIAGDLFYGVALRKLGATELRLGVSVTNVTEHPDHVAVETSSGRLRGRLCVDARGGFGEAALLQVFLGHWVRTERPIFDPDRALLMDFRVGQDGGAHFVYVLPTSRTEALVEDTWFTTQVIEPARHQREIAGWLERAGAGAIELVRSERGVLPMDAAPPPARVGRLVRAGLSGGAAKGSTGYAFAFLQRDAEALARAIASGGEGVPRWPSVRSPIDTFYDRTFLRWVHGSLAGAPSAVGDGLVDLFRHAPLASVARFLSEEAGPLDYARVMGAMPTGPFVKAAMG